MWVAARSSGENPAVSPDSKRVCKVGNLENLGKCLGKGLQGSKCKVSEKGPAGSLGFVCVCGVVR